MTTTDAALARRRRRRQRTALCVARAPLSACSVPLPAAAAQPSARSPAGSASLRTPVGRGQPELRRSPAARMAFTLDDAGLSAGSAGSSSGWRRRSRTSPSMIVRDAEERSCSRRGAAGRLGLVSVEEVFVADAGSADGRFRRLCRAESARRLGRSAFGRAHAEREGRSRSGPRHHPRHRQQRSLLTGHAGVRYRRFAGDGRQRDQGLTEVERAELSQRLLAEAGTALASSLDHEQALQRVVELVVPRLAGGRSRDPRWTPRSSKSRRRTSTRAGRWLTGVRQAALRSSQRQFETAEVIARRCPWFVTALLEDGRSLELDSSCADLLRDLRLARC